MDEYDEEIADRWLYPDKNEDLPAYQRAYGSTYHAIANMDYTTPDGETKKFGPYSTGELLDSLFENVYWNDRSMKSDEKYRRGYVDDWGRHFSRWYHRSTGDFHEDMAALEINSSLLASGVKQYLAVPQVNRPGFTGDSIS